MLTDVLLSVNRSYDRIKSQIYKYKDKIQQCRILVSHENVYMVIIKLDQILVLLSMIEFNYNRQTTNCFACGTKLNNQKNRNKLSLDKV